jgi:hypothetical protein
MIIKQSTDERISESRATLYEGYFQRILKADPNGSLWRGWRVAFENLAEWFLLETGNRGYGLTYETLLKRIGGKLSDGNSGQSLIESLGLLYHFPARDGFDLIHKAESLGLLTAGRRWRFAHDTFEEYFAASRLASVFDETGAWPPLDNWITHPGREQDFLEVLDFVTEMSDRNTVKKFVELPIPAAWKARLVRSTSQPQTGT